MTTNIYDGNSSVMATDSRWSIEYGSWLLYLDDTGYEKIERLNGMALMFAGHGPKIEEYKIWIHSSPKDFSSMPDVKGMSVCMVHESSNIVEFQKHQDIEANNVFCAGSGARPAYSCWLTNKCSQRAVESAKLKDHYSGGEVKYVNFVTSETNITKFYPQAQLTIGVISANIIQRGISMKIHATPKGTPDLPFPKAGMDSANDDEAPREKMAALVASGELSATAPCDGMHSDWSEDDKGNFKRALGKMFGWNN
jgi:hypothetical protein